MGTKIQSARGGFWALRPLFCAALLAVSVVSAFALEGMIGIHDPSTVVKCDGKYYVAGTGRGVSFLVSSNGFDWQRGGGRAFSRIPDSVLQYVPENDGTSVWAPDIIHVNGQYYVYYAVSFWGSFVSAIGLVTSPTLDTNSPNYKWTERGMVVHSSAGEALNAIDPGVTQGPDGRLWICYGSYHGNIELVELDPNTGLRIATNSPVSIIASQSEASDIMYHDGYYYLFVNHGSCCQGLNSTYNIRVGRSAKVTGPYLDRHGDDMVGGGGTLFLAARGNNIGPGHFGLLKDDGVEKFSCHYEGVTGRGGRSILDIRPLLWTLDGWPLPGDNVSDGTYQLRSQYAGSVLQVAAASTNSTPTDPLVVKTSGYLTHDEQKWDISQAGHGFYKITVQAGGLALEATGTLVGAAAYSGSEEQLWKIDQLNDGSYRLATKTGGLVLTALVHEKPGDKVGLLPFSGDDAQRWVIATP